MPPFDPAQPGAAPLEAFRFRGTTAALSQPDAKGRRQFSGVAYSGEAIPNHWYWGNVVFDIGTTKAPEKVPALVEHKPERIAGSGSMTFGADMKIAGLLSAKTPDAKFVADQADEQFPWQMSVFIDPGSIDEVKAGVDVSVNGRQFTGPLTIFRNNTIREVSFCATGADANTSAEVFSRQREGNPTAMSTTPANTAAPTVESLQAALTALTAQFAAVQATNTALTAERDTAVKEAGEFRKARLTEMFKARGEEFTDDKAKPFLAMSAEAFAATLAIIGTPPKRDPKLFSVDGAGGDIDQPKTGALVASAKKMHGVKS